MAQSPHAPRGTWGMDRATRTVTVAALDQVPVFREGLNALISRTPGLRWGGSAASHHAAIQLCEQRRPDVVLLDSALDPRCHLARLLSESHPTLVIVVIVDHPQRTSPYLSAAQAAGAHGLIARTTEPRQLAEGIRRIYVERRGIDPALANLVATGPAGGGAFPAQRPHMPLSRREYQVLQLIAEGMENSAVADTLFLSVETVRTHVKNILRKLAARDRTHAVTKAFRSGLLVVTQQSPDQPPGAERPTPNRH